MTARIWPILVALIVSLLSLATSAVAADPFARATIATKGTIYAGQQVEIDVDVFVPNFFLSPPQFPLFDLPGTVVTMPDDRGLNLNETVDGVGFSGIRKTYIVTPRAAGDYTLPPVEIPFGYAAVPGETTQGRVTLPRLRLTVAAVPGSTGAQAGVTAAKVTIVQTFDRDLTSLIAGDALVRTVTVNAARLTAMMIPEPSFDAPANVQVYVHDPVLSEDKSEEGDLRGGIRKDTATYVFGKPGDYTLPAITLQWFDPSSGKQQTTEAPAVKVSVAAAPASAYDLSPPPPPPEKVPFDWLLAVKIAAIVSAFGTAIWLSAEGLSRLEQKWQSYQSKWLESEAAAFHRFERICQSGTPAEVMRGLDSWSRKANVLPLRSWLVEYGDEQVISAFDAQQEALYHSLSPPDRIDLLVEGIRLARKSWQRGQGSGSNRRRGNFLPQLNPD